MNGVDRCDWQWASTRQKPRSYLSVGRESFWTWDTYIHLDAKQKSNTYDYHHKIKNTLDKLQRLACVCIVGVVRTCSTAALEDTLYLKPVHIVAKGVVYRALYWLIRAGTGGAGIPWQRTRSSLTGFSVLSSLPQIEMVRKYSFQKNYPHETKQQRRMGRKTIHLLAKDKYH